MSSSALHMKSWLFSFISFRRLSSGGFSSATRISRQYAFLCRRGTTEVAWTSPLSTCVKTSLRVHLPLPHGALDGLRYGRPRTTGCPARSRGRRLGAETEDGSVPELLRTRGGAWPVCALRAATATTVETESLRIIATRFWSPHRSRHRGHNGCCSWWWSRRSACKLPER